MNPGSAGLSSTVTGRVQQPTSRLVCFANRTRIDTFKYKIRHHRYVPLTYYDAASLAFGERSFEVWEFATRLGSLRAASTLSELKVRGLVERVGRGKYRLLGPGERIDTRGAEWERVRRLLLSTGLPMAWTGPDAVSVWTGGRYTVSPTAFLRIFHLIVPASAETAWRKYLRDHRIATDPRRRTGARVELSVVEHPVRTVHRGEPVIPRSAALRLIRAHRAIYAEADRLVERDR